MVIKWPNWVFIFIGAFYNVDIERQRQIYSVADVDFNYVFLSSGHRRKGSVSPCTSPKKESGGLGAGRTFGESSLGSKLSMNLHVRRKSSPAIGGLHSFQQQLGKSADSYTSSGHHLGDKIGSSHITVKSTSCSPSKNNNKPHGGHSR